MGLIAPSFLGFDNPHNALYKGSIAKTYIRREMAVSVGRRQNAGMAQSRCQLE
jgi:hypothetical protein